VMSNERDSHYAQHRTNCVVGVLERSKHARLRHPHLSEHK
jgi:hypothetical protein